MKITLSTETPYVTQSDRSIELESSIAHLQHDFDQLHSVVIELQKQIESLHNEHTKMRQSLDQLQEDKEGRDPELERPPHY